MGLGLGGDCRETPLTRDAVGGVDPHVLFLLGGERAVHELPEDSLSQAFLRGTENEDIEWTVILESTIEEASIGRFASGAAPSVGVHPMLQDRIGLAVEVGVETAEEIGAGEHAFLFFLEADRSKSSRRAVQAMNCPLRIPPQENVGSYFLYVRCF